MILNDEERNQSACRNCDCIDVASNDLINSYVFPKSKENVQFCFRSPWTKCKTFRSHPPLGTVAKPYTNTSKETTRSWPHNTRFSPVQRSETRRGVTSQPFRVHWPQVTAKLYTNLLQFVCILNALLGESNLCLDLLVLGRPQTKHSVLKMHD